MDSPHETPLNTDMNASPDKNTDIDNVPTSLLSSQSPPFTRSRYSLRNLLIRAGIPVITFFAGIACVLLYAVFIAGNTTQMLPVTPANGPINVQVSYAFLAELAQKNLNAAGMPGTIQNVQVTSTQSGTLTIAGDDQLSVLFLPVTKHFTIVLQPYATSCRLQVHVLNANVDGIGVTGFVSTFENQINQQLQTKPSNLPQGFVYCAVDIQTQSQQLVITYSATPISS